MATMLGRSTGTAGQNLLHPLRAAVRRLLHLQELRIAQEDRQASAGAIGTGRIPHVGVYAQQAQPLGGYQEQQAGQPRPQAGQPQGQAPGEAQAGLALLRVEEHDQRRRQGDGRQHLPGGDEAVISRHGGGGAQGGEIPGQDGGAPEGADKPVGRAPGPGGDVDADAAGGRPPGQGAQGPVDQGDAQGVGQGGREGHLPGQHAVGELHEPGGGEGRQQQKARQPQRLFDSGRISLHSLIS